MIAAYLPEFYFGSCFIFQMASIWHQELNWFTFFIIHPFCAFLISCFLHFFSLFYFLLMAGFSVNLSYILIFHFPTMHIVRYCVLSIIPFQSLIFFIYYFMLYILHFTSPLIFVEHHFFSQNLSLSLFPFLFIIYSPTFTSAQVYILLFPNDIFRH